MSLLLAFAPFAIFRVLVGLSVSLALWIAFAAAFSLGIRSFLETRVLRVFDSGSVVLFGLWALYDGFIERGVQISWIGLTVESGMFGIALWSLLVRRPFTAQYACDLIPAGQRESPAFKRSNYVLTAVWAATFAIMAAADAVVIFLHTASISLALGTGLAAFAGALTFTWWSAVFIGRHFGKTPHLRKR